MTEKESIYITTTIPYVNADPHIGFALELLQADVLARSKRMDGYPVFFNTGTDEHGVKIWQQAEKEGKDVKDFVDRHAETYKKLLTDLAISNDNFIRTTDESHQKAVQEFWKRAEEAGDIYKKKYKGLYCVGHEAFITEKELENGMCPEHGNKPVEIEEENYFFKLSNYKEELKTYIEEDHIAPPSKKNEALSILRDADDFSISRLKEKMPWGIPVPDDSEQVMYVWFEALPNYISTLGWPDDVDGNFETFWENGRTIQIAGKDQVRFQSIMWQSMLFSLGIKNTDTVMYHGFITSGGKKMSKTIGNVINPFDIIEEYGSDALRYYLIRHIHPFEDSDFTDESFKEAYNAHLANGIGNLTSRITKMAADYDVEVALPDDDVIWNDEEWEKLKGYITNFEFHNALDYLWAEVGMLDAYIAENEPYKVVKEDKEEAQEMVAYLMIRLHDIAVVLNPFMPETSEKIKKAVREKKVHKPLFERK